MYYIEKPTVIISIHFYWGTDLKTENGNLSRSREILKEEGFRM